MDSSTEAAFRPSPDDKTLLPTDDVHLDDTSPLPPTPESRPNMIGCFYIFLYLSLFLTTFLVSFSTITHALSAGRAVLTGMSVLITLSYMPGPLSNIEAIDQISSWSLSSLILASLRTTLIGAAACGICIGVVGGFFLSISFVIKHGFKTRYQDSHPSSVVSSPGRPKNSKRIVRGVMSVVAPIAGISVGIFTQRRWSRASEDLDLIVQDPLRSAVITLVGNLTARGLLHMWASWRAMGIQVEVVGSARAQEKSIVTVDNSSVVPSAPALEMKYSDSPV